MIKGYGGKIGDGKTYHVVLNDLLPALRAGRRVYTNIDGLNLPRIAMALGCEPSEVKLTRWISSEEIRANCTLALDDEEGKTLVVEKGCVVIIDEVQLVWDARDFKKTMKDNLTFFEKHRHHGIDIVWVTQNPKRVDSAIRDLANDYYQVKNLRFLGRWLGGQYVIHCRQSYRDPITYSVRGNFRQDIFALYRSETVKQAGIHGPATPIGGAWAVLVIACAIYVCVTMYAHGGIPMLSKQDYTGEKNVHAITAPVPVGRPASLAPVASLSWPGRSVAIPTGISNSSGTVDDYPAGGGPEYTADVWKVIPAGSECRWQPVRSRLSFRGLGQDILEMKESVVKICKSP